MHLGSYKSLIFWVNDAWWFHTFTEFWNHSDIGWDSARSRRCFPPCSFRSHAATITVIRLCNNFQVGHFSCRIQNWTVQEPEQMVKMLGKCLFQDCWPKLKDSAYQEWVLKDKLDKHYACKTWLSFCVSLLLRWSLQNLTLILISPYKVLIWP